MLQERNIQDTRTCSSVTTPRLIMLPTVALPATRSRKAVWISWSRVMLPGRS